jgi:hypothetical protein
MIAEQIPVEAPPPPAPTVRRAGYEAELTATFRTMRNYERMLGEKPGYWYLATPYAHYAAGRDAAFIDATRITGALVNANTNVYSPILHGHVLQQIGHVTNDDLDFWINLDTPFMDAAIGCIVAKMPGWELSDGILREVRYFNAINKPTVFLPIRPETLAQEVTVEQDFDLGE